MIDLNSLIHDHLVENKLRSLLDSCQLLAIKLMILKSNLKEGRQLMCTSNDTSNGLMRTYCWYQ